MSEWRRRIVCYQVKIVDRKKYKMVYEDVMKKLDKLENEFLPQVTLNTTEVGWHSFCQGNIFHWPISGVGIGTFRILLILKYDTLLIFP